MRMKIRTKIISSTVLIVSLSLFFSSFMTYHYVTRLVREQSIRDNQTKLAQISSSIRRVQERLITTAETIIVDPAINRELAPKPHATAEQSYFSKVAVQQQLQRFRALNSSLVNIMVIRPDGEVFSNNSGYESYYETYLKEDWARSFLEKGSEPQFSVPHLFHYLNGTYTVVSYMSPYLNWQDGTEQRPYYLIMDVRINEIGQLYETAKGDFEGLTLQDKEGQLIFDTRTGQGLPNGDRSEGGIITLEDSSMLEGWRQEAYLSERKLVEKIRPILLYYLLIVLGSLLFIMMATMPVIWSMTKPILTLAKAMKRVSAGDWNTRVVIRSGDEMEHLGSGFNRMVGELRTWMESAIREQEQKRSFQINLLLSEINPHFIYNTLNTVIYLSHAERSKDTILITKALIDILQDTIKTGEDAFFTTLQGELDIVRKYAQIQQFRYPDRFRMEWEAEEGLLSCTVPRMVLQPLVENALFHGIFASEEEGVIRITATCFQDELHVTVRDNGCGFPEGQSAQMEHQPDETAGLGRKHRYQTGRSTGLRSDQVKGIGLANIVERIHYHYGSRYGLTIESEPGKGASVTLRLPLQNKSAGL